MRRIQQFGIRVFGFLNRRGYLADGPGLWIFETGYELYKRYLEAGPVDRLKHYVVPAGWVIDVGANNGFFTLLFARWCHGGGRVIAIEPEQRNFGRLADRVAAAGIGNVTLIRAAAAERTGVLHLMISSDNPGDHRLAANGQPVDAVTLDSVWKDNETPPVSLIKIDVQGAEGRVLAGASSLIQQCRPAIFLELDVTHNGTEATAGELLDFLEALGYRPSRLRRFGMPVRLSRDDAIAECRAKGYTDFLFLAE